MDIVIERYTKDRIGDVVDFERALREEEDFWGWEIDDAYIQLVQKSFLDDRFKDSISLLAYVEGRVVGRIDSTLIASHMDGTIKAYLDWICVVKRYRHQGVAQALLSDLRAQLKALGIDSMVALTAGNEESQRFYKHVPDSEMKDIGIWINVR